MTLLEMAELVRRADRLALGDRLRGAAGRRPAGPPARHHARARAARLGARGRPARGPGADDRALADVRGGGDGRRDELARGQEPRGDLEGDRPAQRDLRVPGGRGRDEPVRGRAARLGRRSAACRSGRTRIGTGRSASSARARRASCPGGGRGGRRGAAVGARRGTRAGHPLAVPRRRPAARFGPSRLGGRSSVGRAPGCGPGGRGFESRRSPLRKPAPRAGFCG